MGGCRFFYVFSKPCASTCSNSVANRTPSRGQELAGTKRATEDQHGGGKDREVFKKRSIHGMEVANAASGIGSGVGCGVALLGVGSLRQVKHLS